MNYKTKLRYSDTLLFVAALTSRRATNTVVGIGWLRTRYYLWRHKDVCEKYLASDALLFVAPQTRSLEMVGFKRATIYGATNTFVENSWLWTRYYLWRHKHIRGK